jgi:hypothetical protein
MTHGVSPAIPYFKPGRLIYSTNKKRGHVSRYSVKPILNSDSAQKTVEKSQVGIVEVEK